MAELQAQREGGGGSHAEYGDGYSPHVAADGDYFDDSGEYEEDYGGGPGGLGDDGLDAEYPEEEEQNEMNFFNPALLSHISVQLRDRVQRGDHVKSGIAWPNSFTGRDIITAVNSLLPEHVRTKESDRRFASIVAHSLQNQLFFVEVDWDDKPLGDNVEDVFQFMSEIDGMGGTSYELPT